MSDCHPLLAEFVQNGSETAFTDLVARYVDLVYSAAVRLVEGDTHLAEDVTQTVFNDLAQKARSLSSDVLLGGWLHRHTCFVAMNTMRGERRRQKREREAIAMHLTEDHSEDNLAMISPLLDEAIDNLSAEDRKAVLLRFFEQCDFESVGQAMGTNEEAARKRVNRALEKLHLLLKKRGVAFSVAGLGTALGQQAVTAAPAGLAAGVAATALAGAATATTTFAFLTIMSTNMKIAVVSAIVLAVAIPAILMQQQSQKRLRAENAALREQADKANQLASENERLAKLAARGNSASMSTNDQLREVLKLRGDVARLRTAATAPAKGPSALSGLKSDTNMWNTVRNQQKAGLGMAYKAFSKNEKLSKEQAEQLSDLHADAVMDNIDVITSVLQDGKTPEEAEPLFAAQDAALLQKVQEVIGADKVSAYQDYTHNLLNNVTVDQFNGMLTGDKESKAAKSKQLLQVMKEETQAAIANAGLPSDYQATPMLNFRNIAFEDVGEKAVKLMDGIYERVGTRASSFLSPEEMVKLNKFRADAVNNNRMALTLNRKLMAPGSK